MTQTVQMDAHVFPLPARFPGVWPGLPGKEPGTAPARLPLPGEDPQAQAAQGSSLHLLNVAQRVWRPGYFQEDWGIFFYFEYNLKSVKLFLNDKLYDHRGNSSVFQTAGYYLLVGIKSVE